MLTDFMRDLAADFQCNLRSALDGILQLRRSHRRYAKAFPRYGVFLPPALIYILPPFGYVGAELSESA